jgi:hypothetical protein
MRNHKILMITSGPYLLTDFNLRWVGVDFGAIGIRSESMLDQFEISLMQMLVWLGANHKSVLGKYYGKLRQTQEAPRNPRDPWGPGTLENSMVMDPWGPGTLKIPNGSQMTANDMKCIGNGAQVDAHWTKIDAKRTQKMQHDHNCITNDSKWQQRKRLGCETRVGVEWGGPLAKPLRGDVPGNGNDGIILCNGTNR